MRIAVALSGQPRTWRHTIGTLRQFFGDHHVEYFLHTWDEIDPAERDALLDAYEPRAAQIEARPTFLSEKQDLATRFPIKPPLTVFDMFHSVAASLRLALDAHAQQPFDLICRARFDLIFNGDWRPTPLADDEISASRYPGGAEGCSDQFALGRPHAMQAYAGVSAWLRENLGRVPGPSFRPETALLIYLRDVAGLRVTHADYAVILLREGQVGRAFADLRDDPMFHAEKHEAWEAFAQRHFDPAVVGQIDFTHNSRQPLRLLRDVEGWLGRQTQDTRKQLLSAPWPKRVEAIDAFLGAQAATPLDSGAYGKLRYFCATLLHLMEPNEPLTTEAFIVHALSANRLDVKRGVQWAAAHPARLATLERQLRRLKTLGAMFGFADPLKQPTAEFWRVA